MTEAELFVGLKIPDTTAITALDTIKKVGYAIKQLKRTVYYKFIVKGDKEKFEKKIGKIDVLVNTNKNKYSINLEKERGAVYILVQDIDDRCENLLVVLRERLGITEIKSMERGVLWTLFIDSNQKEKIIKKIGNYLLHNENYQKMKVM